MRKLMMFLCLTIFVGITNGQTLRVSLVDEFSYGETKVFCADTVTIYVDSTCEWTMWCRPDFSESFYSYELTVTESQYQGSWRVTSDECMINMEICVYITSPESNAFNPFDEPFIWKHPDDTITLGNPELNYLEWLWSTDETSTTIDVVQDGTYSATNVNDPCGPRTYSIDVYNNVEIDLATCDLESNLNLITWQTNPAQAQYIDHVIVKRDGLQVGTADYSDGQFTDNIGSGSASRTYTLTAVATDGTECPIVSYPKETIHMAYLTGINNTIEVNWNVPAGYDLLGYNICEWHEDDGSLTVIDYVGASVTSYTCSESQFDEGYIVVQGVETGKDGETRLLSNRSLDLVGLGENEATAFRVYPNPANGILFVETCHGASLQMETYRIVNPIGQIVMEGQITMEKQQISVRNLPKGVYFITVGSVTRKFVVE